MKGTSKGKKKKSTTVTSLHYSLIPVILTVAVLPLITYLVLVPTNLAQYSWYDTRTEIGDLFLYRKMQFFLVVSAVALLTVGFHLFQQKKHIKCTKAFLPLFIYGLFTLLSAVFSDFSSYSFHGILD